MKKGEGEWEKFKEWNVSRDTCNHNGGRMIIDNVSLACCKGTAVTCKTSEFRVILQILRTKMEENEFLKSQIEKLQNKANVSYNNCTMNNDCNINNTVNNDCNVNNDCVINNCNIMDTLQIKGATLLKNGGNIYNEAFKKLCSLPPTKERTDLINLFKSVDPRDNINFKQQIVNLVQDSVLEDETISSIELASINDCIDKENDSLRIQAEEQNMLIEY